MAVSVPFSRATEGYHTFRIPAIVKAGPALVAFAEARRAGADDSGDIDIVVRRSTDGGLTWGSLALVVAHGADTAGNPVPVVSPGGGELVLVSCRNGGEVDEAQIMRGEVGPEAERRVYVQRSADGGQSWTSPQEITAQVKAPGWRWYATGPGHGVVTRSGRLVVPANHSVAPPDGSPGTGAEDRWYGGHAIYSDDDGRSWQIGFVDSVPGARLNANETTAAELPDGRLYFNTRVQGGDGAGTRADAHSTDAGQSLVDGYRPQPGIATPIVQGSVLQVPGGPLLYAGPGHKAERVAMTVWVSDDQGAGWRVGRRVSDLPAGYSDLVFLDDDTVGLLYETGDAGPYERLEFVRIPLRELA